ncbi:MAG TPA: septal ring lytic transglycosylase RlpA family protein [Solirubrobacteraceae bacterium]|nr:septal ring lytic transglycosylase RlpA family protein [Solirubrobacteraceae bacterium]
MRTNVKTATTLLALLAGAFSACALPAGAAASTGGAAAPSGKAASQSPAKPRVRPTALATWFGPGFYGKQTACGQTLTPAVLGVANRTLPCGTLIKVSYGSHAVTLPVIDRGPYGSIGADWDLTGAAAQALGITETVRVHARVVGSTRNVPTLGLPLVSATSTSALAGGAQAG